MSWQKVFLFKNAFLLCFISLLVKISGYVAISLIFCKLLANNVVAIKKSFSFIFCNDK